MIRNVGRPVLTAFFAAGFSFGRGHRLLSVPYDPYAAYLFDGEEMSMAARLWTSGYDFYAPDADVVFHLYSPNSKRIRPVFWDTAWSQKWPIAQQSELRINFMLGIHQRLHPAVSAQKYDLREIEKYGLGDKRRIEDFWNFTRIDLDKFKSEDLCAQYQAGGMDDRRVPWMQPFADMDPYHPMHGV